MSFHGVSQNRSSHPQMQQHTDFTDSDLISAMKETYEKKMKNLLESTASLTVRPRLEIPELTDEDLFSTMTEIISSRISLTKKPKCCNPSCRRKITRPLQKPLIIPPNKPVKARPAQQPLYDIPLESLLEAIQDTYESKAANKLKNKLPKRKNSLKQRNQDIETPPKVNSQFTDEELIIALRSESLERKLKMKMSYTRSNLSFLKQYFTYLPIRRQFIPEFIRRDQQDPVTTSKTQKLTHTFLKLRFRNQIS